MLLWLLWPTMTGLLLAATSATATSHLVGSQKIQFTCVYVILIFDRIWEPGATHIIYSASPPIIEDKKVLDSE